MHRKRIGLLSIGLAFAIIVGQQLWAVKAFAFPNPQATNGTIHSTSPPATNEHSPPPAVLNNCTSSTKTANVTADYKIQTNSSVMNTGTTTPSGISATVLASVRNTEAPTGTLTPAEEGHVPGPDATWSGAATLASLCSPSTNNLEHGYCATTLGRSPSLTSYGTSELEHSSMVNSATLVKVDLYSALGAPRKWLTTNSDLTTGAVCPLSGGGTGEVPKVVTATVKNKDANLDGGRTNGSRAAPPGDKRKEAVQSLTYRINHSARDCVSFTSTTDITANASKGENI